MTQDALNTTLSGQTGTGNIISDDSPILTGDIDCTGATTVTIPSSANPIFSSSGEISLDSGLPGYNTQLTHYSGSENLVSVSLLTSDLSATDGYGIVYNSSSSKFEMAPVVGVTGGTIVQFLEFIPPFGTVTSSTTYVDAFLTGSITPTNASNIIVVQAYATSSVRQSSGSPDIRVASHRIYRTTGAPAELASSSFGRQLSTGSAFNDESFGAISLYAQEVAGDTNLHTYTVQHLVLSALTVTFFTPQAMVIMEVTP